MNTVAQTYFAALISALILIAPPSSQAAEADARAPLALSGAPIDASLLVYGHPASPVTRGGRANHEHPAVAIARAGAAAIDANAFIVQPPASTAWTQPDALPDALPMRVAGIGR